MRWQTDPALSCLARGLLAFLVATHDQETPIRTSQLRQQLLHDPPHRIQRALRDLCAARYLIKTAAPRQGVFYRLTPHAFAQTPILFSEPESPKLTPRELIALYNQLRPTALPKVQAFTEGRRTLAQRALKQRPDEAFWRDVFAKLDVIFLTGNGMTKPGEKAFKASYDWLLRKGKDGIENYIKVSEGKYQDTSTLYDISLLT